MPRRRGCCGCSRSRPRRSAWARPGRRDSRRVGGLGVPEIQGQLGRGAPAALVTAALAVLLAIALPVRFAASRRAARAADRARRRRAGSPTTARVRRSRRAAQAAAGQFHRELVPDLPGQRAQRVRRPAVQQVFRSKGVTLMKGDWTNRDPAITKALATSAAPACRCTWSTTPSPVRARPWCCRSCSRRHRRERVRRSAGSRFKIAPDWGMLQAWPRTTPAACRSSISAVTHGAAVARVGRYLDRVRRPAALVHGIALIRASQPNICVYGHGGRLRLQVGPEQYALVGELAAHQLQPRRGELRLRRRFTSCRAPAACCSAMPTGPIRARISSAGSPRGRRIPTGASTMGRQWSEGVAGDHAAAA
jgi:hypothetical protein